MRLTSEQVLVLAERVKTQKAQSAKINSLSETKDFDKIKTVKGEQTKYETKPQTHAKMPADQSCRYCGSSHQPRGCLAYGKKCIECHKISHFREVCRSGRNRIIHDLKQKQDQHYEEVDHIGTININSIYLNNKIQ